MSVTVRQRVPWISEIVFPIIISYRVSIRLMPFIRPEVRNTLRKERENKRWCYGFMISFPCPFPFLFHSYFRFIFFCCGSKGGEYNLVGMVFYLWTIASNNYSRCNCLTLLFKASGYPFLVYTTQVNSAFREIWLVPQSRDMKYYYFTSWRLPGEKKVARDPFHQKIK